MTTYTRDDMHAAYLAGYGAADNGLTDDFDAWLTEHDLKPAIELVIGNEYLFKCGNTPTRLGTLIGWKKREDEDFIRLDFVTSHGVHWLVKHDELLQPV